MVKLGSKVVGIHDGEPFEGKLIGSMPPLFWFEEKTVYGIELLDGSHIGVTANEFVGVGGSDAEEAG